MPRKRKLPEHLEEDNNEVNPYHKQRIDKLDLTPANIFHIFSVNSRRYSMDQREADISDKLNHAELGYYFPFKNREVQIKVYIDKLSTVFRIVSSCFASELELQVNVDMYRKACPVFLTCGAPGIGKTCFARVAVDKYFEMYHQEKDPFHSSLRCCYENKIQYHINYACKCTAWELSNPGVSFALRLLYEICKYSHPCKGVDYYGFIDQHLQSPGFSTISLRQVLLWLVVELKLNYKYPIVVINLDEISVLIESTGGNDYLSHLLSIIVAINTTFPLCYLACYFTATKSLKISEVFRANVLPPKLIDLPLLSIQHSVEIVKDIYKRAHIAKSTCGLSTTIIHLLRLLSGNPRFIETFIFALGQEGENWKPEIFVQNIDKFNNLELANATIKEDILSATKAKLIERYPTYRSKVAGALSSFFPQLLGYCLFHYSVRRTDFFGELTVETLEDSGFIFLEPDPSSEKFRIIIPFIWLNVLYADNCNQFKMSNETPYIVPLLPILKTVDFTMASKEFEEFVLAVLALKIYTFYKMMESPVIPLDQLLGFPIEESSPLHGKTITINLPVPASKGFFRVRQHKEQIVKRNWKKFLEDERRRNSCIGYLNGDQASNWDGVILSDPPLLLQTKQRLNSRITALQDGRIPKTSPEDFKKELQKGIMDKTSVFIFVTDDVFESGDPVQSRSKRRAIRATEEKIANEVNEAKEFGALTHC
jgi:hypothetical protein